MKNDCLEADRRRRDFSVNAIYFDFCAAALVDSAQVP